MLTSFTNAAVQSANDAAIVRNRTTPISQSITPVPSYPSKLVVYKIAASRFWQVRCWVGGRTHKRSTKTQNLRSAQSFARVFYEQLVAKQYKHLHYADTAGAEIVQQVTPKQLTFGALAAQMFANEQARTERMEFSLGSLQVLRNRLDAHILPRWASKTALQIDYKALLEFTQFLSANMSSTTISQYLVAVRKVLSHAIAVGELAQLPVFPRIKIVSNPRGAFTPSQYWQIMRASRKLRGETHPDAQSTARSSYMVRAAQQTLPPDLAWAIGFMVNSFIRPSDLKTLKHKHVEVVRANNTYLRLTLPKTKSHDKPIVTLYPAVRINQKISKHYATFAVDNLATQDDSLFLPKLADRNYALRVLSYHFNWVLEYTSLKFGANAQQRSLYSLRHSAITFRLLYGQGIDLLTLARNARTSVEVINNHYASSMTAEQNIGLLQSRRKPHSAA